MGRLSEIATIFLLIPFSQLHANLAPVKIKFNNNADVITSNSTLICAHVVYRHGDRNIVVQYPNDPYKEPHHWPGGMGQLTNEGKMQLYKLGQYFRRRYNDLLGANYSSEKVFIRSTDLDRTLMSAQANLAGLFPPEKEEKWHKTISWQPIPVHTAPIETDKIFYGARNCPRYFQTFAKYVNESEEVQQIYRDYVDLFSYWSKMCGLNLTTIKDVYNLHKTLSIEKLKNKKLDDWANEAIVPNGTMEQIALFNHRMAADTPELARLNSGPLIKEILDHFTEKINSTLIPGRLLWFYSAHETTIGNLLNSLKLLELHIPPYASSLHFELHKNEGNNFHIQIFYRKSGEEYPAPMNIPGCGTKCPLNQFYNLYKPIIPVNYESECQISQDKPF